ncbi:MAG: NAD(P)-binding protein [Anaerovoracaceae bacterium]
MKMEEYYQQFEHCRQEEKPFCEDRCPLGMDVLDFMDKLSRKRYNVAYKTFRDAAVFPDIVAALCPEYCHACCPRTETDEPIQVNLLEKTCVARATRKKPNEYNLPAKKESIGIIGGGISGLACALRLASKKYQVEIYEQTHQLGGCLKGRLPEALFLEDIQRQFQFEDYKVQFNQTIHGLEDLAEKGHQAIYIATGKGGETFGLPIKEGKPYAQQGELGIFVGGSLLGKEIIPALADGIKMAKAIENYLKTGNLNYPEEKPPTEVVADTKGLTPQEKVVPTDGEIFTEEEMERELARCIRCQCNGCRTSCDIVDFFDKWPLKMRDEIMTTTMPADSMIHKTPAIKLINTCTQCMSCDDWCPGQIQLGRMIKEARKSLHQIGRMPGAYHQFWVRDMEFANGQYGALTKKAPGRDTCEYAFFPGCHLGAANPEYVYSTYRWLIEAKPDTGILLRCCAVPADWAGNEALHQEEINHLIHQWESLGKPILIMACPSCMRHIKEYVPEIKMVSLYQLMEEQGLGIEEADSGSLPEGKHYIFDPCAAKEEEAMKAAVRTLAGRLGIALDLEEEKTSHGCCGYGGNVQVANPEFSQNIGEKRAKISDYPYLTYCINCRDVFLDEGKQANHILDFLLQIPPQESRPSLTQRRENRVLLKERLLHTLWEEEMEKPKKNNQLKIIPQVMEKMNGLKLLEEDILEVIEFAEQSKRRTFNPETETYKCYREIGSITCWVEYKKVGEINEVVNVYTHRMKIELEGVWNGRKTDNNM